MSDCYYGAEACKDGHTVDCPARAAQPAPAKEQHRHEWEERHTGSWTCKLCRLVVPYEDTLTLKHCQRDAPGAG